MQPSFLCILQITDMSHKYHLNTVFMRTREYCENEPDWEESVVFLKEGDGVGWDLLKCLLRGEDGVDTLVDHPFFQQ